MKVLVFGSTIESKDIAFKLDRITGKNEYINTYDIETFPKMILFEKPDMVIVTANGEYGKDCVSIVRGLNRNIPLFWFSNDENYSVEADLFNCTYFAKKPVFSKTLSNAMQNMGTVTHINRALNRISLARMVG